MKVLALVMNLVLSIFFCSMSPVFSEALSEQPQGNYNDDSSDDDLPDDPILYIKKITHFKRANEYEPCNAAALIEVNANTTICSRNNSERIPCPEGFDLAIPIWGKHPINGTDVIFAFILTSKEQNMVVLSFIGTYSLTLAINNYHFSQVPPTELNNYRTGLLVHEGFYSIYKSIYKNIREEIAHLMKNENQQLVITGFSLGGALANLAAFDLSVYQPIIYTFAAPRVGNCQFAHDYNGISSLSHTWRVFNTEDNVPTIPPAVTTLTIPHIVIVYEHVGNPVPFTLNTANELKNHTKSYYKVLVEQESPTNPNGMCPQRYDCSKRDCPKPNH